MSDATHEPLHPLRVAVGEDDVLLRGGIVRILEDAGLTVVVEAGDANDLLRKTWDTGRTSWSPMCGCRHAFDATPMATAREIFETRSA